MDELKAMCHAAEARLALNGKELHRPEPPPDATAQAQAEEPRKLHEGDLYLCAESLDALEGALGGVCEAVDAVFHPAPGPRRAFVAIRPPGHHCSATYPSGFCWVNNVHVGIMHAILSHGLTHAAIIDFDLHHGDGSQAIAWQHNSRAVGLPKTKNNAAWWKKAPIGYFSLHDINSYPCETGDDDKVKNASLCLDGAHGQHVWNVHLQPWKTEAEFWDLYDTKYSALVDHARRFLAAQADRFRAPGAGQPGRGAIFLSAGFDASEWEGSGMQRHNVNVPTDFYARLTRDVVRMAADPAAGVDGRVVSLLEGGYSDRALCSGVLSHLCGLAAPSPDDPAAAPPAAPRRRPVQRARLRDGPAHRLRPPRLRLHLFVFLLLRRPRPENLRFCKRGPSPARNNASASVSVSAAAGRRRRRRRSSAPSAPPSLRPDLVATRPAGPPRSPRGDPPARSQAAAAAPPPPQRTAHILHSPPSRRRPRSSWPPPRSAAACRGLSSLSNAGPPRGPPRPPRPRSPGPWPLTSSASC